MNDYTVYIPDGTELIVKRAYAGNSEVRRVVLPSSVRTISDCAFAGCTSLEEVCLGEGVRRLGEGCFEGCSRLREIRLPASLASLRSGVFRGCENLRKITLPEALQRNIGSQTFAGCKRLEAINIPPAIHSIHPEAFRDCESLREVRFEGVDVRIAGSSFRGCTSLPRQTLDYIAAHIPNDDALDIRSSGRGLAGRLSNYTARAFTLDGVACGSIEGVLQAVKCPDPQRQREICSLSGGAAKSAGQQFDWKAEQVVYWQGRRMARQSAEYAQFITRLYDAAYEQDEQFRKDAHAVCGMAIDHSMGSADPARTILTRDEFLNQLRRLSERN